MSKQNNLTDFLTDVANAIRTKKGTTGLINPQNFSAEIASLSGGLEIVEMAETTATIEPNKVYVWGMVESLNITLGTSTNESDFFAFRFRCSKPTMTVVTVNGATWADDTELDAQGKPILDLGSWYQCEIKGGTSALYARLAHYIPFADSNVEAVLLANGVGDGLGVTYKDAAKVKSISTWFKGNTDITAFAEFVNFLGISNLLDSTFNGCSSLAEISLPASLTRISNSTFNDCSSLAEISLPASLTRIGISAFQRCSSLAKVLNLENTKVTSIDQYVFRYCTSLAEITFPASLTSIGAFAFQGASFEEITLPASLTYINSSFYECKKLKRVINLENTQLTSTGGNAFYGCSSLAEISLPASLTSIGDSAFQRCSSLAKVLNLENTKVTSIDQYVFRYCTSLAEITFPASLTSIGAFAFQGCKLSHIILPEGVTSISNYAFDISSLQYIRIEATTPPTLESTNAIPSTIGAIYVPDESVAAYQAATNWSSFASKIKGISEMPA